MDPSVHFWCFLSVFFLVKVLVFSEPVTFIGLAGWYTGIGIDLIPEEVFLLHPIICKPGRVVVGALESYQQELCRESTSPTPALLYSCHFRLRICPWAAFNLLLGRL